MPLKCVPSGQLFWKNNYNGINTNKIKIVMVSFYDCHWKKKKIKRYTFGHYKSQGKGRQSVSIYDLNIMKI